MDDKILKKGIVEPMRLRYLVTLKGKGKVNRKVSPRVIYIYIYIYGRI